MQRFIGGLVFKAHRLCVSLISRLESNKEEEEGRGGHPTSTRKACRHVLTLVWYRKIGSPLPNVSGFILRILVYLLIYDSG